MEGEGEEEHEKGEKEEGGEGRGEGEQTGERKETEEEEARTEGRTKLCRKHLIQQSIRYCDPDTQVKINKDCSIRVLIWQLTQEWN